MKPRLLASLLPLLWAAPAAATIIPQYGNPGDVQVNGGSVAEVDNSCLKGVSGAWAPGSCGGVSSVSNADGTVQVSPTTGSVVVSLSALPSGNIFVGNASSVAIAKALSGDCTIVASGAITCTKSNGSSFGSAAFQSSSAFLQAANNLSDLGNVSSARSSLGLVIGTNVEAWSAQLDSLSGKTLQGNGTKVQLSTGTTTTNDCVKFDVNGNTVDNGTPCAGGSGSVTSVAISGSNGIGVSGSPVTSSGTIGLSLGAITPTTVTTPSLIGGTTPSSQLNLYSTSGTGTTDQINFFTGNGVKTAYFVTPPSPNTYTPTSGSPVGNFIESIGGANPYTTPGIGPAPSSGQMFIASSYNDSSSGNISNIYSTAYNTGTRYTAAITGIGDIPAGGYTGGNVWGMQATARAEGTSSGILQAINIEADKGTATATTAIGATIKLGDALGTQSVDNFGNSYLNFLSDNHVAPYQAIRFQDNTTDPVASTGCIMCSDGGTHLAAAYGIDFHTGTFSGKELYFPGFNVDGTGLVTATNAAIKDSNGVPSFTINSNAQSGHPGDCAISYFPGNATQPQDAEFDASSTSHSNCGIAFRPLGAPPRPIAFHADAGGNAPASISLYQQADESNAVVIMAPHSGMSVYYNFNLPTTAGSSGQPMLSGGGGTAAMSWGALSGNTTTFGTTSGSLTSGHCAKFDASGNIIDAGAACGTGGSGTVTTTGTPASGNLAVFSGLTSVTNTDLTGDTTTSGTSATTTLKVHGVAYPASPSTNTVPVVTGSNAVTYETDPVAAGGTGLTSGTSGGILAFTGTGTLASSAALTANAPVIGGGAGVAPSSGSRSGNTTTFATASGTLVNGHCVSIDGSGNFVDAGGACTTGGGGGTVNSATAGQLAYYASTGTAVTGNANATISGGAATFGVSGTALGSVAVAGSTSGAVTIKPQAIAGTYNFNLPATVGSSGQPMLSGGGGTTAMSWGALSGNTSTFATTSGTLTSGDCAKFDSNGNVVDFGATCGGGSGSPGGSSGQLQYNNGGAFGGFTASGDATINTSTGAVAVTKTGGTAFGPAATALAGQIPGTATNDSAAAGDVGEIISSNVGGGSPVTLTSGSTSNITSITLTPGDWTVEGDIVFSANGTTSYTSQIGGVSATSATISPGSAGVFAPLPYPSGVIPTTNTEYPTGNVIVKVATSTTTTVYLCAQATFTASSGQAYGAIRARRMR